MISLQGLVRFFTEKQRQVINEALKGSEWVSLTKEFSLESYTKLKKDGLDLLKDCVSDEFPTCKKDIQSRMDLAKHLGPTGTIKVYKGRSDLASSADSFYRFFIVLRANKDGTYDIFLAYVCLTERVSFWESLRRFFGGTSDLLEDIWKKLSKSPDAAAAIEGVIKDSSDSTSSESGGSGGMPSGLADDLMEFEFVNDMAKRGTFVNKGDHYELMISDSNRLTLLVRGGSNNATLDDATLRGGSNNATLDDGRGAVTQQLRE